MPLTIRFACVATVALLVTSLAVRADNDPPLPPALRGVNPRLLSGGLYSALDASGAFDPRTIVLRARDGLTDLSKGKPSAVLDARVGVNIRLGADPAALSAGQTAQAEPHITRSVADANVLLATFQEGRFATGGGAVDCGYALSSDGGLTWTRSLIPRLTLASGGNYQRATDPVAAIGPQGDLYLATLASLDNAFGTAALVVSRSTDSGATWTSPAVVFQQTTAQAFPDKDWLTVNDYAAAPNAGRLVATWTNFTSNAAGTATGNNLLASVSDDRGATWSSPIAITPTGALNQGSLPLFLPDGSLVVIYATFPNANTSTVFSIDCKRSTDGGRTYPATATRAVANVAGWDDPDLRSGVFLPAAAVARTSGDILVTYTAVVASSPRVLVIRSSNQGATWSTPVVVSDNPNNASVDNPAIGVTPDGQVVSVFFMDKRLSPVAADGHRYFLDHYAAQSFDGGATWQPNLRLTEMTSDIRYAPQTAQGYMLGDYLAVAPSLASTQPCVAIWCDTRSGDADPFTVRFTPSTTADFAAWGIARGASTSPQSDSDSDGELNLLEYANGTDPRTVESGEDIFVARPAPGTLDIAWTQRPDVADARVGRAVVAVNPDLTKFVRFAQVQLGNLVVQTSGVVLTADQLPKVSPHDGLVWTGERFSVPPGAPLAIARGVTITNGIGRIVDGAITTSGTDARLINVATRGQVGTAASQMIVGFVIDGQKNILVRAAGPALTSFGVSGVLADPRFVIGSTDPAGFDVFTNDNWSQGNATPALFARLGAFPFTAGSLDAAFQVALGRRSYSAIVSGANNGTGVALVEAYDADATPGAPIGPRFVNLSTRGNVGTSDNALIAGFVVSGTQPRRMLIRAIGPSLAQFGLGSLLVDPQLTLFHNGTQVATNDDWEISRSSAVIAATAQQVGAFALNPASLDAALLITLAPGSYTVVVTGVNGATGLALVEVYDAD